MKSWHLLRNPALCDGNDSFAAMMVRGRAGLTSTSNLAASEEWSHARILLPVLLHRCQHLCRQPHHHPCHRQQRNDRHDDGLSPSPPVDAAHMRRSSTVCVCAAPRLKQCRPQAESVGGEENNRVGSAWSCSGRRASSRMQIFCAASRRSFTGPSVLGVACVALQRRTASSAILAACCCVADTLPLAT